jgi:hypothetical protein
VDAGETIWDETWAPASWSQSQRRVRRDNGIPDRLAGSVQEAVGIHEILRLDVHSDSLLYRAELDGREVILKLDVSERALYWTRTLSEHCPTISPKLIASGDQLGDLDVRWVVMERLEAPPDFAEQLVDAVTASVAVHLAGPRVNLSMAYDVGQAAIRGWLQRAAADSAPMGTSQLLDSLETDWLWLDSRCASSLAFGDLHAGNVMARDDGSVVLIDPIPRVAPWMFDAAYAQVISATPTSQLCSSVAQARQAVGLPVLSGPDLSRAESLFLGWMAALWWGNGAGQALRQSSPAWTSQAMGYITAAAALPR